MQFIVKLRTLLLVSRYYYILFFIVISFSFMYVNIERKSIYDINQNEFILYINDYKTDGNKLTLELNGKEKLIGNYAFNEEKEKEEFIHNFKIGDYIKINGELVIPKNNTVPNTFNYKKYLYNKGIFYTLKIEKFEIYKKNRNLFLKIKNVFYNKLNKINNNEYLYAFILGEKSYINKDIYNSFSTNGITHLFALSGLHVGVLSSIIFFFIRKLKISEMFKYIIVFIFLILLSFITGFSASIMRASLLFILIGINKIYYFFIKTENLLLVCGSILLIINPFLIYDLSFLLSFTITYFILLNINNFSKSYIKSLLEVSFISFLASLPIIINNFYNINLLSILNNLFFVPYVSFIIYPLSLFIFVCPVFINIYQLLINVMEKVSMMLINVDFLNIYMPKTNFIFILIHYILLILWIKTKKTMYLIIIIILLVINYMIPYLDNNTYIYFTDVGQGDSILIVSKNNKSILIDTGGSIKYEREKWEIKNNEFSLMKSSLIPFYKSIGLKKIDYLIITHGDEDHIGNAKDLINNFKVENIYINKGEINSYEEELDYKILDNDIKIDNVFVYSLNDKIYDNENDNSLILNIKINNFNMLFMGDANVKEEKYIIKNYDLKNIDILKVGHHGSKTSTCKEFINVINPKYSIISVGENNRFNHPSKSVLDTLNASILYRTDISGSILYKISGDGFDIKAYSP